MKVLIVGKTRRGPGACVGGICEKGRSLRLIAGDADYNERAGLEYEIGDVWEIEARPDPVIIPPHVENVIVKVARRLRRSDKIQQTIWRFMPPAMGGPDQLFERRTRTTSSGGLYISKTGALPSRSTMFWVPDKPLLLDFEGKRIRYRYPTPEGGCTVTFVGFQEPVAELPAGTLLRVSLAHWWRPFETPDEEERCFVQLSGWFLQDEKTLRKQRPVVHGNPAVPDARTATAGLSSQEQALQVLKRTFGFSEFLPLQWEVIKRVLDRKHTLVVMPTGAGKSLCYQLPTLLSGGLTVVLSPLVALMRDQVNQLEKLGVPAACLNHLVPLRQYKSIMQQVRAGHIRLLYLAPETLLRPETLLLLEQSGVSCIAIDEAHCISEWGHDFRPEYREIAPLRRRFPQASWLALTATATGRVRNDIRNLLGIPSDGEFVASFNRKNLHIAVEPRRDCLAQVLEFLQSRRDQSGIIYCGKRKQADQLCAELNANGWPALTYHAGMEGTERNANQEKFIAGKVPIIVATIAFGMGINKPDVRFVLHAHMPRDLESYYQEIGRGGRDGLPAVCLLLYSRGDAVLHRRFIEAGAASERTGRKARLEAMLQFAETRECRRKPLLAYFGETLKTCCGACDNCKRVTRDVDRIDQTAEARMFLSCARLTNQIFGQDYLIQILRGSRAEKIIRRRDDRLPMYGAGKQLPTTHWQALAAHLLELGFLNRDLEFGSLRLTPRGFDLLNGKEKFSLPKQQVEVAGDPGPGTAAEGELLQKLKALRKQLANANAVPAFVIFSDRTLVELARRRPQTSHQFLAITGVGQFELTKYGTSFLELIREHYKESGTTSPEAEKKVALEIKRLPAARSQQIGEMFIRGQTLEQIAIALQIKPATAVENLAQFQAAGGQLKPDRLLRESKLTRHRQERVFKLFRRLGLERLSPVFEAFGGTVPYEELHLLRLYWVCKTQAKPLLLNTPD